MTMPRPREGDYPAYCQGYVGLVPETDILGVLEGQLNLARALPTLVPAAQEHFRYASGKWTIREVAGHVGDCERVFGFRAMAFSRLEASSLPGFDESAYVANARFDGRSLEDLSEEFVLLRQGNLRMLRGLSEPQWDRAGVANGHSITVRALAFLMVGHLRHHLALLRDHYGVAIGAPR